MSHASSDIHKNWEKKTDVWKKHEKKKKKTGILMNYSLFKHAYSQSKCKMNVCKINNSEVQISWTTMKI